MTRRSMRPLTHIEQEAKRTAYKPLVFICSPYAGNIRRNTERAREYCRFAVSKNCIPIAPHLLFPQFMEEADPAQRELGIFFGLVLQSKCREVWVFGRSISKGMAVEIEKAKGARPPHPIFYRAMRGGDKEMRKALNIPLEEFLRPFFRAGGYHLPADI